MPSKDALCFLAQKSSPSTQRDLDELVYQIKEKLKVKARAPSHATCSEKIRLRASPYSIPSRGSKCGCCDSRRCMNPSLGSKCGCCDSRRCMHRAASSDTTTHHSRPNTDDPYEALQELLRDGDLIKEAVRRLNINCFTPKDKSRNMFYDSDEERTPYPFNVQV